MILSSLATLISIKWTLDAAATPMQMLRRLAGKISDATLRSFLGSLIFAASVSTPRGFSGGERARLTLALIVWQRPNVPCSMSRLTT